MINLKSLYTGVTLNFDPVETKLISLIQNISHSHNKNIQIDITIMDFAKAFDKVPHKHLFV